MIDDHNVLFDRVGLCYIERYWWNEGAAASLYKVLDHFLSPSEGRAWFRNHQGEWARADEENWEATQALLFETASIWMEESEEDHSCFVRLRDEGEGRSAIFMDADRFRACVDEKERVPGQYYVGFEVDWSFNPGETDTVLTPHIRISNRIPAWDRWAPQDVPDKDGEALSAGAAVELLEDVFWTDIRRQFQMTQHELGLLRASIKLTTEDQNPPAFYYASPAQRLEDAEGYLQGDYLKAINELGSKVLASPDLRSLEITGGVMEGCLAVFNHSPKVEAEYCLMIPLDGKDEASIERQIQFSTYCWHDLDLDATWKVLTVNNKLEANKEFYPLWLGSLGMSMDLNETLFPLLGKEGIQVRMFDLAHMLTGFLAKLQARTFAEAMNRSRFRQEMEWAIIASKNIAQRRLTVRTIPGLQLMRNISDGYTRVFREFEEKIGKRADEAHKLSDQIEVVSASLSQMAGFEEREREKGKKEALEREEKATKRLNQVLALVAVLAAIPLLVGQYDTQALSGVVTNILSTVFGWLPLGDSFQGVPYWSIGLWGSFLIALAAFTLTLAALARTLKKPPAVDIPREDIVETASQCSESLFDSYRDYRHGGLEQEVSLRIKPNAYFGGEVWESASETSQTARARVDQFDRKAAEAVARAMDQCATWHEKDDEDEKGAHPDSDEAWAREMEKRVCRFVLASDVFDLRPEKLHLPATLSLYRWKFAAGGLGSTPVSDWEYEQVMAAFGYTEDEINALDKWAHESDLEDKSAAEVLNTILGFGLTARHEVDFSPEQTEE